MALSDYLTGEEWDACFYASMGQHAESNFGKSMDRTIQALLAAGYRFPGLDDSGHKRVQVCGGVNAPKVCLWFGNAHNVNTNTILDNGRTFLKQHLPSLVDETDMDWEAQLQKAAEKVKEE